MGPGGISERHRTKGKRLNLEWRVRHKTGSGPIRSPPRDRSDPAPVAVVPIWRRGVLGFLEKGD